MRVLGINAIFHDPAAALVVDGRPVAAAEEERFNRRKHGKRPVPFSAWEQPVLAARWCLEHAGLSPADLDAVGFSYDPSLVRPAQEMGVHDPFDDLRTMYARMAPGLLAEALPGLDPGKVVFVPHHVAHAASAGLAAPADSCAVLVNDGRGEDASHLAGRYRDGGLEVLASQRLPHSLGLFYEALTEHLGFLRSSDEYKVMALASYGKPRHLDLMREAVRVHPDGAFRTDPIDWASLCPARAASSPCTDAHADVAASAQRRLEEVLLEQAHLLHERTGERTLAMAGGTALNCVANTVLARRGPFERIWVQPAAGDAGTSLGAALRLNDVKGRERFRPVAPMVLAERAAEIFLRGPLPSPYMLFVHDVAPAWQDRIPAVVHVDGTARVQTVDPASEPLVARLLRAFERRTGLPVLVNTSLNTAGRPMVDDIRDALECFGSTPIDLLALGSFAVRR